MCSLLSRRSGTFKLFGDSRIFKLFLSSFQGLFVFFDPFLKGEREREKKRKGGEGEGKKREGMERRGKNLEERVKLTSHSLPPFSCLVVLGHDCLHLFVLGCGLNKKLAKKRREEKEEERRERE